MRRSTSSETPRAARRIRPPKKAREWIDRAAVEIAASPAEWRGNVDTICAAFGGGPPPPDLLTAHAHQFVGAVGGGGSAASPIRPPEPRGGGGGEAPP